MRIYSVTLNTQSVLLETNAVVFGTRSLQFSPFENPGGGSLSMTEDGRRTEILMSNIGYHILCTLRED